MNKELEALERIKRSHFTAMACLGIEDKETEQAINSIETTLKRQDSIEITAIDIELDNKALCKENKKLKRILEIIIKKEVEIGLIKGILHADKSLHTASYYNSHFVAAYRHLTQKEFDLLKDIIKNESFCN